MQSQKLCLKWNNHTTNLLSVLGGFQQKDILVDVTISCEGQNIKAHKIVLSACSPYFQNIFLENPCKHPVVIINGIKYDDITAILTFMYKGEVNVSHDGLSSFLQAAEALKVKGLAEVCEEKKSTKATTNQDVPQNELNRPQRTDTPPRKRHRNRKRSMSDSNRSDDEGSSRKHRGERSSPEIHELSGDESFTGDNTSNGPPFNSLPRVPQNVYSRSHQSSSNLGGEEDDDFEVEPSKLLEQTLTTDNVSMNNSNSDNNLRIERIMGNATDIESSSMQEPESPPDIKPIIDYGESSAGPSDGNLMLYNEQSQPGPSNMQDGSLIHDNSHTQASTSNCMTRQQFEWSANTRQPRRNPAVGTEIYLRIWQGLLVFPVKSTTNDQEQPQNLTYSLPCTLFSRVTNGSTDINADNWPNRLVLRLFFCPKLWGGPLQDILETDSHHIPIRFNKDSESLPQLCELLDFGLVGIVLFPPNCGIHAMVVVCTGNKQIFKVYIPNDQDDFLDRIEGAYEFHRLNIRSVKGCTFESCVRTHI